MSSVKTSPTQDLSSSIENRHIGHVFRHALNHLSMQSLWKLCRQGRLCMFSPSFNLHKHTQQDSTSLELLSTGLSARPCSTLCWASEDSIASQGEDRASLTLSCLLGMVKVHTRETNIFRTIWSEMVDRLAISDGVFNKGGVMVEGLCDSNGSFCLIKLFCVV